MEKQVKNKKKRFLKGKAIFIIFTLIFSTLVFPVFSQEAKADEQRGCCQKTKDNAYCQITTQDNCQTQINPVNDCSLDSSCSSSNLVTCQDPTTGKCDFNVYNQECSDKHFTSFPDASGNSVQECKQGCCIIGSQCSTTTQKECDHIYQPYPNAQEQFKPDVTGSDCEANCRNMQEGCCVTEGTYIFEKQADCTTPGEFNPGKMCSDISNSPCTKHAGTKCFDNTVYNIDSCGNKEDKVKECKLADSTFCKNIDDHNADCVDTSCPKTYVDKWNIHDLELGHKKQEGEAWCVYESPTGNYLDRPGSIHYRHYCFQAQEIVEPCRNFREQICVENSSEGIISVKNSPLNINPMEVLTSFLGGTSNSPIDLGGAPVTINRNGFTFADCVDNKVSNSQLGNIPNANNIPNPQINPIPSQPNAVQSSSELSTDTSKVPVGFAFWESQNQGVTSTMSPGLQFLGQAFAGLPGVGSTINSMISNSFNQMQTTSGSGSSSNMPRTEPNVDTTSRCSQANQQVTVKYLVGPSCPGCVENCYAEETVGFGQAGKWITKKADQCKSLGDCGVDFGVEADQPSGFLSFTARWTGDAPGPRPTEIDPTKLAYWGNAVGVYLAGTSLSNIMPQGAGGGGSGIGGAATGAGVGAGTGAAAGIGIGLIAGGPTPLGLIGAGIGAIVGFFGGKCKTKTKTVTVTCNPWQPPQGGSNCKKCTNQKEFDSLLNVDNSPFNTCTEYRCRALGTTCRFIPNSAVGAALNQENNPPANQPESQGTQGQANQPETQPNTQQGVADQGGICVDSNPTDVNSPVISPNYPEFEKQDIKHSDITEYDRRGFEITKKLDAFKPLTIDLLTDELAICAYSLSEKTKFADMDQTITTTYTKDHRLLIPHPPSDPIKETTTSYYIICQDTNGNPKGFAAPYEVKFTTKNEPDLAPPVIDSILPGTPGATTFIQNNVQSIGFMVLVSDSSQVECRWSTKPDRYDSMPTELTCPSSREESGIYYECTGTFTNIQQGDNTYYVSCKDESDAHNEMQTPKDIKLTGTTPLKVDFIPELKPLDPLYDESFTLGVVTSGGAADGIAHCQYSINHGQLMNFVNDDNTATHTQYQCPLTQLQTYHYHIVCTDIAGNQAQTDLTFTRAKDTKPIGIVWINKEQGELNVYVNKISTCKYSDKLNFNFDNEGTVMGQDTLHHTAPLNQPVYYIQCEDKYKNRLNQPIQVYNI